MTTDEFVTQVNELKQKMTNDKTGSQTKDYQKEIGRLTRKFLFGQSKQQIKDFFVSFGKPERNPVKDALAWCFIYGPYAIKMAIGGTLTFVISAATRQGSSLINMFGRDMTRTAQEAWEKYQSTGILISRKKV